MKRSLIIMLILCCIAGFNLAQSTIYTGYMGDDVSDDRYTISLQSGQTIYVTAEAIDGDLDTYIALEDPDGQLVAENDDRDDQTRDSFFSYPVYVSGEYIVVMSNYPETSGNYNLTIDILETHEATTFEGGEGQTTVYTGYMGDDVSDQQYTIDAEAGQTLQILAEAVEQGTLDTYIVLQDANGQELVNNDDADKSTYDSYIQYRVEASGTYTVIISNYPETKGNYRLTIRLDGPPLYIVQDTDSVQDLTITEPDIPPDAELFTGLLEDNSATESYQIELLAGQAVIASAWRTSGDLDPTLQIYDSVGKKVAYNDDRDGDSLDSELTFIAQESGVYTVTIDKIFDTSGDFLVAIRIVPGDEARVSLSGDALLHDTEHFRIHYTLSGGDAVTDTYVLAVAEALEIAYDVQINKMAWDLPPHDGVAGGDERYDVYLINIEDHRADDGELGYTKPQFPFTDNINTPQLEEFAAASFLVLDNDYEDEWISGDYSPLTLMRTTAAHEYHHAIQFGYDVSDIHLWYYEATSTWFEYMTFPQDETATTYIDTLFSYPEVCFGGEGPADPSGGTLVYGWWLFIQSLVDEYGPDVVYKLWLEVAQTEGWESLENLLIHYDDSIVNAVRRFHIRNLARDYAMTASFEFDTIWLENSITEAGKWTFRGSGVQELAVNYYEVMLDVNQPYDVYISSDNANLELWAMGVHGGVIEVIELGRGGLINPTLYKNFYLMVFNPNYDNDVMACHYNDYSLYVNAASGEPNVASYKLSGAGFRAPHLR